MQTLFTQQYNYKRIKGETKTLYVLECTNIKCPKVCEVIFFTNPIESKEEIQNRCKCLECKGELVDSVLSLPF